MESFFIAVDVHRGFFQESLHMSTEGVGTAIGGHADKEKQASTVCTMDLLLLNLV